MGIQGYELQKVLMDEYGHQDQKTLHLYPVCTSRGGRALFTPTYALPLLPMKWAS